MRRLCAGTCGTYFHPASYAETLCDTCASKLIDHEAGMVCQDNAEVGDFLKPGLRSIDAMSLAKARITNAELLRELTEWKRFARSSYSAICSLAAPRMFPKDRETLAKRQLEIFEKDFPSVIADIVGEPYAKKRG